MVLPIISASDRMKEQKGITGCIFGKSGIGKTSLLWTIPAETTLFFDLEAGDLSIYGWKGDTIRPKTWQECRDFAVFISGPNLSFRDDQLYSKAHYDAVCSKYGKVEVLNKYETIFIDSITVAARLCFNWCKGQPQAFSQTGKVDTRGAYGLHGQEMLGWLTHLQHTRVKNIWFIGILDEKLDEFNRRIYQPQIEGSKTGLELPGIVDQVITMAAIPKVNTLEDEKKDLKVSFERSFVCHTINDFGYPAKDRSGRLDVIEEPHLGNLMNKIKDTTNKNAANPFIKTTESREIELNNLSAYCRIIDDEIGFP